MGFGSIHAGSNPAGAKSILSSQNGRFGSGGIAKGFSKPRFGSKKKSELEKVKKELEVLLPELGKTDIKALRSIIYQHWQKRFRKNHPPKYGSLNKGFSDQEFQAFFAAIDNEKFRLLFGYQAQLGLRIGEAVRINIKDINFETRELLLQTEKAKTLDTLLIPLPLFRQTIAFIKAYSSRIEKAGGYMFFKEPDRCKRPEQYLDTNYARNMFCRYVRLAKLDMVYAESDEPEGKRSRRLHRLTTHSLRHYAITSFARQTNGNVVLTSRFARHTNPSNTMTYISTSKQELYKEIDGAFGVSQAVALKAKLSK